MTRGIVHLLLSVAAALVVLQGARADDKCFVCHETLGDNASTLFKRDVHYRKGITCAGCHGGDPTADEMENGMDPQAGFIGVPKGDGISSVCARCHSDAEIMKRYGSVLPTNQLDLLRASVHGALTTGGRDHLAQCTVCHSAHGIAPAKNPASPVHPLSVVRTCTKCHNDAAYMRRYNPALPVDQLEKYRTSVHGIRNARGDPKVAECVSCHGGHDIRSARDVRSRTYAVNLPATCSTCHSDAAYMQGYKLPTDQFEKFARSVHGVALLQRRDFAAPACNDCHGNHGATPPGVSSISKVCGTCHALNADLFSVSPHKRAFEERRLPECETCHGNHEIIVATNRLLGVAPEAVCSGCHTPTENRKGYEIAREMRELIDSLEIHEGRAAELVRDAEQKGMEISEAKFKLREARQARLESRTMVHSFDAEKFREVVGRGLSVTDVVSREAGAAIDEFYFRRIGLGVATLAISLLALSLYLYIRRIEQHKSRKRETASSE